MKKTLIILSILCMHVSLLLFVSCDSDTCWHSRGELTALQFPVAVYDSMVINGLLNVVLVEDSLNYVEFRGGTNELEFVKAYVKDSCLWLENDNSCLFLRDYERITAFVHFQSLRRLQIFSPCKLESQGTLTSLRWISLMSETAEIDLELDAEVFGFLNHVVCGGKYKFSGRVGSCWMHVNYSPLCDISELVVRDFTTINASLSDFYVNATEELTVEIRNSGNIYYSGDPEIIIESITGTGKLLPWEE